MANLLGRVPLLLIAVLVLRFTFALGLKCEDLTREDCAFAVSSKGARCVLEKVRLRNGAIVPSCQTSFVMAEKPEEFIESEECIKGCGVERESYGLSTDALLDPNVVNKLCSAECRNNCPNIIDLYLKLAAGEGIYLPHVCVESSSKSPRVMADPVQVAEHGPDGLGRSDSTTHVNLAVPAESWDPSSLLAPGPAPQPSPGPVYGPAQSVKVATSAKKSNKLAVVKVSPPPAGTPVPLPAYDASAVLENEFDEAEYLG